MPRRSFQIEAGVTSTEATAGRELQLGEVFLRYGLFSGIELRLALNSYDFIDQGETTTEGLEDTSIGAKIDLPGEQKGARPQMALMPAVSLPTGSESTTNDAVLPSLTLLFDWTLGGPFSFNSNLGWQRADDDGVGFDQFFVSVALGVAVGSRLVLYFEPYLYDRESPDGSTASYANAGFDFNIRHTLSLDVSVGAGLSGTDTDYYFGFGTAKRW